MVELIADLSLDFDLKQRGWTLELIYTKVGKEGTVAVDFFWAHVGGPPTKRLCTCYQCIMHSQVNHAVTSSQ